jgi:hypothetical protein
MSDETFGQSNPAGQPEQQPGPAQTGAEQAPPIDMGAQASEQTGQAGQEGAAGEETTREALDDLKTALAQFASAAAKLGQVAGVRARAEWQTTNPELKQAIEEMKRGIETAATRASSTLDNLAKKVDRPGTGGEASGQAASEQPTEPVGGEPPTDGSPNGQPPA